MQFIDLNADIGEAATPLGRAAEAEILKLVSSANIACGGHAGDDDTMYATARAANMNGVVIGAHPSYPDPHNFGRKSMTLGSQTFADMLRLSLTEQIVRLSEIAADVGARVKYVKPHGALYNDAVKSRPHANLIASVIKSIDATLKFMGAPNSEMRCAAQAHDLQFITEGFIDRRYTDDGHLQSRAIDGAVISSQSARMEQAMSLVKSNSVVTASGAALTIRAQSLCVHGDSAGAVETARQTRRAIEAAGITIRAFAL